MSRIAPSQINPKRMLQVKLAAASRPTAHAKSAPGRKRTCGHSGVSSFSAPMGTGASTAVAKPAPDRKAPSGHASAETFTAAKTTATSAGAKGPAYADAGGLAALLTRNLNYLMQSTTAAKDDDANYYLRRCETNAGLSARFADPQMQAVYQQFINGPLREAAQVRSRQLGELRDGGPKSLPEQDFTYRYQGQQYTIHLGGNGARFVPAAGQPDIARIGGAAYKDAGGLEALLQRSFSYMGAAKDAHEAGAYFDRNVTNEQLPERFANDQLRAIYSQFVAGPLQRAKDAIKSGQPVAREDFQYTYQGTTYTVHLGSDAPTDTRPALPSDPPPVDLRQSDPARIAGAAYKDLDGLKALFARNVDWMLHDTTAAPDDDANYYLRRNETNASLGRRFADDDMIQAYRAFLAGPLREARDVRNRQLGELHDGGPTTFAPRDYTFSYRGQTVTVHLG